MRNASSQPKKSLNIISLSEEMEKISRIAGTET